MNITETFNIIEAMYSNKPFRSETGELIFVPDPLDRLINACELIETLLYRTAVQDSVVLTDFKYKSFLGSTYNFILSIPIEVFKQKTLNLEYSTQEILLRNLDHIMNEFDDSRLTAYSAALGPKLD